jgi:hypothetical protein
MRKLTLIVLVLILVICHAPKPKTHLPHRPEWSLYRQAMSPGRGSCAPPLMPYYLELPDGAPIFLECYRGTQP